MVAQAGVKEGFHLALQPPRCRWPGAPARCSGEPGGEGEGRRMEKGGCRLSPLTSRAIWLSASSSAVRRSRFGSRLRPAPGVPMVGRSRLAWPGLARPSPARSGTEPRPVARRSRATLPFPSPPPPARPSPPPAPRMRRYPRPEGTGRLTPARNRAAGAGSLPSHAKPDCVSGSMSAALTRETGLRFGLRVRCPHTRNRALFGVPCPLPSHPKPCCVWGSLSAAFNT